MCHMSCVMCHMSHFLNIFFDNLVKLIGGGSDINGAYPVMFFLKSGHIGGIDP